MCPPCCWPTLVAKVATAGGHMAEFMMALVIDALGAALVAALIAGIRRTFAGASAG